MTRSRARPLATAGSQAIVYGLLAGFIAVACGVTVAGIGALAGTGRGAIGPAVAGRWMAGTGGSCDMGSASCGPREY